MILKSSQVGNPGADAILTWLQCFLTSKPLLVQSTQFHTFGPEEMAALLVNPHERVVRDPRGQSMCCSTLLQSCRVCSSSGTRRFLAGSVLEPEKWAL